MKPHPGRSRCEARFFELLSLLETEIVLNVRGKKNNPKPKKKKTTTPKTHKKKPQTQKDDVLLYTFLPWGEDTRTQNLRCVLVILMSEHHRRCTDNDVTVFKHNKSKAEGAKWSLHLLTATWEEASHSPFNLMHFYE